MALGKARDNDEDEFNVPVSPSYKSLPEDQR